MNELVIRIPGEPFAQPRARAAIIAGRAVIYDPKRAKNWKATAQGHMAAAVAPLIAAAIPGAPVLHGPIALRILAVFTCPKSDHRKRDPLPRRWHTKRPDGDNVLKAVKDAAKGVLWLDDSQVVHATVIKIVGAQEEPPFVLLTVRAIFREDIPMGGCPAPVAAQPPGPSTTNQPARGLFEEE